LILDNDRENWISKDTTEFEIAWRRLFFKLDEFLTKKLLWKTQDRGGEERKMLPTASVGWQRRHNIIWRRHGTTAISYRFKEEDDRIGEKIMRISHHTDVFSKDDISLVDDASLCTQLTRD